MVDELIVGSKGEVRCDWISPRQRRLVLEEKTLGRRAESYSVVFPTMSVVLDTNILDMEIDGQCLRAGEVAVSNDPFGKELGSG